MIRRKRKAKAKFWGTETRAASQLNEDGGGEGAGQPFFPTDSSEMWLIFQGKQVLIIKLAVDLTEHTQSLELNNYLSTSPNTRSLSTWILCLVRLTGNAAAKGWSDEHLEQRKEWAKKGGWHCIYGPLRVRIPKEGVFLLASLV